MVRKIVFVLALLCSVCVRAQYNADRQLLSGQVALHYEDYVLSIQYFNRVISAKPYLYQPWQYRAVAKFYLDDFVGAENDVNEAIRLNPYIDALFDLRAIARIRQEKYEDAIQDYTRAISLNPQERNFWFNRAICRLNAKQFDQAQLETDTIIQRWAHFANAYSLKAELFLQQKDTAEAAKWLDKSLEIDPYEGSTWTTRAYISLSRREWRQADSLLSKAIHLKPTHTANYINRALARFNYNNLRGAMADYDTALDLDPNNFIAHYNRGLLRMQLGDDNRAILDFDYVIKMEPQNVLAIFNRGILHEKTGNPKAAIADFTTVIDQFPNFWTGLAYRARCYRHLGMNAKAEMDEFRILKAQLNKHQGTQQRWSQSKQKEMRKRSEIDPEKYNQIVVEDEHEVEHEYKSEYRGRIQNRQVDMKFQPMFELSYLQQTDGVKDFKPFDKEVEQFNVHAKTQEPLLIACHVPQLSEAQSQHFFSLIEHLSNRIAALPGKRELTRLLLQRSVAYAATQNFDDAINDLNTCLSIDSTSSMAYWQRAVCQARLNDFQLSNGIEVQLKSAGALHDISKAISLSPQNAFLYYNRANMRAARKQYAEAIDDYTEAIRLEPSLAEAYYNRALTYIIANKKNEGIADMSKAGELGLYDAYSVIKKIRKEEQQTKKAQ